MTPEKDEKLVLPANPVALQLLEELGKGFDALPKWVRLVPAVPRLFGTLQAWVATVERRITALEQRKENQR